MENTSFFKFILVMLMFFYSCKTQNEISTYKKCLDKNLVETGIDFYSILALVEKDLLSSGVLRSRNREGYIDAFNSLYSESKEWKEYYKEYQRLQKDSFPELELTNNKTLFFLICSNIDPEREEIRLTSEYVQRYLFKQYIDNPLDDPNLLDGLIMFTDYKNDFLRNNLTYLLILNMEERLEIQ